MVAGLKEEELGRFSRKTVWWWYVNQCHFPVWTCPRMQLHFCGGESMCLLEGLNNSHHSLGGTQNRLVLILCTEAVGPSHCSRPQRLALRASLSNNDRPKTRSSLTFIEVDIMIKRQYGPQYWLVLGVFYPGEE